MQSMTTMETLEETTLSMTESLGTITFCAYHPRTQQPIVCRPLEDRSGKLWTGQGKFGYYELLTVEEKANLPFIFTHETSIVIEEGKVLNLSDPYDAAVWVWLQKHPYIATDKRKGEFDRDAVYYIANERKEAKERIDKTAKIDEARPAVRKLSETDRKRAAKSLGLESTETFTPEQILDWLLNKCNTNPEAILATIDPGNKGKVGATLFLRDAVKYGVINREKDGAFYFGGAKEGITLGHTDEMVVDYLLNPENVERVKAMKNMLAEKSKTTV